MSRFFGVLIVAASLSGCRNSQQSAVSSHSSETAHLRELYEGPGGPRVITLDLGEGDLDALPDPIQSNSIPGSVSVSGIRIVEGSRKTVGVLIALSEAKSRDEIGSPKTSEVVMGVGEALAFENAVNQETSYALACIKNPPKHQGDMIWRSAEGFTIDVSSDAGSAASFTLSATKPDRVSLSLPLDRGKQLIANLNNALKMANGDD